MRYLGIAVVGAMLSAACSQGHMDAVQPSSADGTQGIVAAAHEEGGTAPLKANNEPPAAVFQTIPADSEGTITGGGPLEITFNLCRSRDVDADDLKYTYDFDNNGEVDFFGHCRATHAYRAAANSEASFQAKVCVSDRQPVDGHVLCQTYDIKVVGEQTRLCNSSSTGVVNKTLTVSQPLSKAPHPITPVYAIITNFTAYTGPFPYFTGAFRVSESGSYTANLQSSVSNGFYILKGTFSPSTGTPSTPLSDFMVFSQQLTNTTISNITLEADRQYSYVWIFSTGNSPVQFTVSGPGGVCFE